MKLINKALNISLKELLQNDNKVLCLGEDLADPYGGAFKVTKGLSTSYPERVISTPVSEAAIVGVGTGLSMMGFKPIVELMFGDFIFLAADQIINHLVKFYSLNKELKPKHIVIRTPMGGGRGYGPTHSQSLENYFIGVKGLKIISINHFSDAGQLLRDSVNLGMPVLFIENKLLYGQPNLFVDIPENAKLEISNDKFPDYYYKIEKSRDTDFLIITYGGMSKICYEVLNLLYEEQDIVGEMFVPTDISECNFNSKIKPLLKGCRFLITVEEGKVGSGFGSEVIANISEITDLKSLRIGLKHNVIPSTRTLEEKVLPTVENVYIQIIDFLEENL